MLAPRAWPTYGKAKAAWTGEGWAVGRQARAAGQARSEPRAVGPVSQELGARPVRPRGRAGAGTKAARLPRPLMGQDVFNARPLETSLPVKSRCLAGLVPSNRQWLPHSSFPTLCVQELFSDFTWEMPEFVNQRCPNNDSQTTCKILRNKIKKKRNRDYLSKTVIL